MSVSHHKGRCNAAAWFSPSIPWRPERWPFFYGWVVVMAATLGTVFSIPGQTMGFSVFTEILMEELGLSRVSLSVSYCLGTVLSGLSLPLMGKWMDRWGERRMGLIAVIANFLILMYLSQVARIVQYLKPSFLNQGDFWVPFVMITLGFFLIRLSAQGVLSMACRNLMGRWFDQRRGLVFALSSLVVSLSFSLAPRWLDQLTAEFGYQGAWQTVAWCSLLIMAPVAWACFRDQPEESGLLMDGRPPGLVKPLIEDMVIHQEMNLNQTLKTYAFWAFNLSFAFYAMFATAFTFHLISLGESFGFEQAGMIRFFFPMAVISILTNLLFGWLNSRMRLKYLLGVMNLGSVVGVAGLCALDTQVGPLAYVLGNGVAGGGFVCLSGIVWPRFFGRAHLGSISGVNMSTMVIASGLGPLVYGMTQQWFGSYQPVLWLSLLLPMFLMFGSFWADNPQRTPADCLASR